MVLFIWILGKVVGWMTELCFMVNIQWYQLLNCLPREWSLFRVVLKSEGFLQSFSYLRNYIAFLETVIYLEQPSYYSVFKSFSWCLFLSFFFSHLILLSPSFLPPSFPSFLPSSFVLRNWSNICLKLIIGLKFSSWQNSEML